MEWDVVVVVVGTFVTDDVVVAGGGKGKVVVVGVQVGEGEDGRSEYSRIDKRLVCCCCCCRPSVIIDIIVELPLSSEEDLIAYC